MNGAVLRILATTVSQSTPQSGELSRGKDTREKSKLTLARAKVFSFVPWMSEFEIFPKDAMMTAEHQSLGIDGKFARSNRGSFPPAQSISEDDL